MAGHPDSARLDRALYARGLSTLLSSWEANARGSAGAALQRLDGVAAAVFPSAPERAVYNNAVLELGLERRGRRAALEAMETAYAAAGVDRFAAWAHDGDELLAQALGRRGYSLSEWTRAMAMESLDRLAPNESKTVVGPASWAEYLAYLRAVGLPPGLLGGVDPSAYHVLAVRFGDELLSTGLAFDHDGDCAIFNLSTLPEARGRGYGSAVTLGLLRDARARGCWTASLQSTPRAEALYARLGFADLGRFLEFTRA